MLIPLQLVVQCQPISCARIRKFQKHISKAYAGELLRSEVRIHCDGFVIRLGERGNFCCNQSYIIPGQECNSSHIYIDRTWFGWKVCDIFALLTVVMVLISSWNIEFNRERKLCFLS